MQSSVGFPALLTEISVFMCVNAQAARIYCWDCEDPFLSEEESILVHRPKTVIGPEGEEMQVQTGPMHRFHPLVEEDCAICKHRHERYEKGLLVSLFRLLPPCLFFWFEIASCLHLKCSHSLRDVGSAQGDEVMRSFEFMDEAERKNFSSRNAMEYLKSTQDQSIRSALPPTIHPMTSDGKLRRRGIPQ